MIVWDTLAYTVVSCAILAVGFPALVFLVNQHHKSKD